MITPLVILEDKLPQVTIDLIQSYLKNDFANEIVGEYFDKLYEKKENYDDFIFTNYVYPKCKCNNCPDNGVNKIFKRRDCNVCFMFESEVWHFNRYYECISDNLQYQKITYGYRTIDFSDEEIDDYIAPFHYYYNKIDGYCTNLKNRSDYTIDPIDFQKDC